MEYFIMKTDKRLRRLPQIQIPQKLFESDITKTSFVYIEAHDGLSVDYADYLEKPSPLIADRFQKILQKYQQDLILRRVILVEKEIGMQKPYYLMIPSEIICADKDQSKYGAGGSIQDFVLDVEKVEKRAIFLAKDYGRQMVVRLDVAESILRREANGIWFEPVKISERKR